MNEFTLHHRPTDTVGSLILRLAFHALVAWLIYGAITHTFGFVQLVIFMISAGFVNLVLNALLAVFVTLVDR